MSILLHTVTYLLKKYNRLWCQRNLPADIENCDILPPYKWLYKYKLKLINKKITSGVEKTCMILLRHGVTNSILLDTANEYNISLPVQSGQNGVFILLIIFPIFLWLS